VPFPSPSFDQGGSAYGALTLMGRWHNFDDSRDGPPARELMACASISAACGYPPERFLAAG
jgi:hypothetical protein